MALDEVEAIRILWEVLERDATEILGTPDDASAIRLGNKYLVVNVDVFDEVTDMLPGMSYYDVGWKALVMALSDVVAKGARPRACLVGLGLPSNVTRENLKALAKGLRDASAKYSVSIWGGDTGFSDHFYMSVTALGIAQRVVSRGGAKPGDLVVTTGRYGLTAVAYKMLLEGYRVPQGLERIASRALAATYKPTPELAAWPEVLRYATASIDSSDGLALSLHYLAESSNVSIVIRSIPIDDDAKKLLKEWGLDPVKESLYNGGEEFELIATIPRELLKDAAKAAKSRGSELIVIGQVEKGEGVYMEAQGSLTPVEKRGWIHRPVGGPNCESSNPRRVHG